MRTPIVFGIIASILPSSLAAEQPAAPSPRQAEPPAAKAEPAPVPPAIPEDIRKQFSEHLGKSMAFEIQYRFNQLSSENRKQVIDVDLVRKIFLDNISHPVDEKKLTEDEENIGKAYKEAYKAYSKAKSALFLKENAKKPNVILLNNGIQCTVTTDKDPAKNYRIEEATRVDVGDLDSEFPTHARMSSESVLEDSTYELSDESREFLKTVPEGTQWKVYIPASALDQSENDQFGRILVLTFRIEDETEQDDKDEPEGRDKDIEDEE